VLKRDKQSLDGSTVGYYTYVHYMLASTFNVQQGCPSLSGAGMVDHASNLRRLMAKQGLTFEQVVERTRLSERTVKTLLAGTSKPHARTLHRVAEGLGVPTDELFQDPSLLAHRLFDRATNPLVEELVAESPGLFAGWSEPDFDELYSRFGHGGALTTDGVLAAVQALNRKREIQYKVDVLLESSHAELISGIIDLLYQKVRVPSAPHLPR